MPSSYNLPTPIQNLRNDYTHSSKLSEQVYLFWTLTISDDENVDEIQFAVVYHLPKLDLHDSIIDENDDASNDITDKYWLAFGISPQGGMIGADFMIYVPQQNNTQEQSSQHRGELLLDAHGTQYSFPVIDSCGQDWTLLNYSSVADEYDNKEEWHILQVKRALASNDVNEDVPFLNDSSMSTSASTIMTNPTHVLVAWGELKTGSERESDGRRSLDKQQSSSTPVVDYNKMDLSSIMVPHGPLQRVSTTVRFFESVDRSEHDHMNDAEQDEEEDNIISRSNPAFNGMPYIDLIPKEQFIIPSVETTYKNFCFTIADMDIPSTEEGEVHIIGFQNIIQKHDDALSPVVHHMDLHGTTNAILSSDLRLCRVYMDLIHPWEAGSPTEFTLPLESGIPMGYGDGGRGYKAFRLEVHYHNPNKQEGRTDQSGVRIYYSIEKRMNVAGLMLLGDYMLKLRGSYTVGSSGGNSKSDNSTVVSSSSNSVSGGMKHSFYCPPSCFSSSRLGQDNKSVTVFRMVLHMHESGSRMTNVHLDANGTILHASEANYFDFSRGAGYAVRGDSSASYQIKEGDSFVTSCYFATKDVIWGSSSGEEMCQTFIWYYPKQEMGSLSCGYDDGIARKTSNPLDPMGCEVGYDRRQVSFDLERLNPNEQCQATELSRRPINSFESTVATRQEWPSLSQLVKRWDQSRVSIEPESKNNSSEVQLSSKAAAQNPEKQSFQKDCHLCGNGERPANPDTLIPGFSWTCDELDAAIPVLYSKPELLYFSPSAVPPCEVYVSAFGKLCCTKNSGEGTTAESEFEPLKEYSPMIVVTSLLLFIIVLMRRYRNR